jgi:acyl-CoA thioester hydrolase
LTGLRGREAYRVWREIGTRWGDNDAYGHVNNTVYYQWFDTAVNAWLIESGLLDVASGDPIGLAVETGCRYARPLSYPEPVEVGLAVERVGRSSVRYRLGARPKRRPRGSSSMSTWGGSRGGRLRCRRAGGRCWRLSSSLSPKAMGRGTSRRLVEGHRG